MITALESINGIAATRLYFSQMVAELSVEDLNFIPGGFNNNIAWHLGHIISVQQSLCYGLSRLSFKFQKK
ncbi:MAG: DinB family protein [Ferruginibacter sp.]|nr:DinB family protein [Ferruginibacter sp.]